MSKSGFDKMSTTTATLLMMILTIAVLMLPAMTISYAQTQIKTNILLVEDDYVNGTDILMMDIINETSVESAYNVVSVIGEGANASTDSAFYGYRTTAPAYTKPTIQYMDVCTYIGNGTYDVSYDNSYFAGTNYTNEQFIVEMDIAASDFIGLDFIRITTDAEIPVFVKYDYYGITDIAPIETSDDTYIIIPDYNMKSLFALYPNMTLYLVFNNYVEMDESEFTFAVEGFTLTPADAMIWSDEQIYVLTILGCDIILGFGLVFTTNFIDVKFDKSKPKKSRKYGKR